MTEDTAALAEDIEDRLGFEPNQVSDDGNQVFVDVQNHSSNSLAGMDRVCAIAYDHGFVPVGIIQSGASRFVPRDDDEVRV